MTSYNPAVSDDPALNLEQFAKVTVRLRAGTRRDRALREANIDAKAWLESQIYWLGRMASLVASGKGELHDRFLEYCADLEAEGVGKLEALPDELDTGDGRKPRLAPLRPEAMEIPDVAVPSPVPSPVLPSVDPVPPPRGSYPQLPVPPPTGSSPGAPPMPVMAKPGDDVETLDAEDQAGAPPPIPFQAPAITTKSRPVMSTMGMPQFDPNRASTPFEGSHDPPQPSEPPRAANLDPLMQTMAVSDRRELKVEALPFGSEKKKPPPTASSSGESKSSGQTQVPPPPEKPVSLPFIKGPAATPPKIEVAGEDDILAGLGQTVGVGVGVKSPLAGMVLPFEGPKDEKKTPALPELTVEQYASLKATCEVFPERTEAVGKQYGVPTPAQRDALDESWRKRLSADPTLEQRLGKLIDEYRAWLASQRT